MSYPAVTSLFPITSRWEDPTGRINIVGMAGNLAAALSLTGPAGVRGPTGPTGAFPGVDALGNLLVGASGTVSGGTDNTIVGALAGPSSITQTGMAILGYLAASINPGNDVIAVGNLAGMASQGTNSISIGLSAGQTAQGNNSIAVGWQAGNNGQSTNSIAIGVQAGQTAQADFAIAIGIGAGQLTQGEGSIAVGANAGQGPQGETCIAVGTNAGQSTQGDNSICIGTNAGQDSQGVSSVAIGGNAGLESQGDNAVAIGLNAGITNQAANSIVLNGSGTALNAAAAGFYVQPVRTSVAGAPFLLMIDNTTGEIAHSSSSTVTTKTFVMDHPLDSSKYLIHACLEGPEAGVYYRGKDSITCSCTLYRDGLCKCQGSAEIFLPTYAEAIADDFTVQITPIYPTGFLNASLVKNGKFTVYGAGGSSFCWAVQGRRSTIEIEPDKASVALHGAGTPYTWVSSMYDDLRR